MALSSVACTSTSTQIMVPGHQCTLANCDEVLGRFCVYLLPFSAPSSHSGGYTLAPCKDVIEEGWRNQTEPTPELVPNSILVVSHEA